MTAERLEQLAAEEPPRVPLRRRLRPVIGTLSVVAILLVICYTKPVVTVTEGGK